MQPVFARGNVRKSRVPDETAAINAINEMFPDRAIPNPANEGIVQPFSPAGQFNIPPLDLVRLQRYRAQICHSFEGFNDFIAFEMNVQRETTLDAVLGAHKPIHGSYAKDEGFGLILVKGKLHRVMMIEPFTNGSRRIIEVDRGVITTKRKSEIFNLPAGAATTSSALMRCQMAVQDLAGYNDRWAPHFRDMIRTGNHRFVIEPLEDGNYFNLTPVKIYVESDGFPPLDIGNLLAIATAGPAPEPRSIDILRAVIKYLSGE